MLIGLCVCGSSVCTVGRCLCKQQSKLSRYAAMVAR